MRYSLLFCVMALPVMVFAQPIEGPFVVLEAGQGTPLKNVHVASRGDSLADIFFVHNQNGVDEVRAASFSFVSHELVSGPEVLFQEEGWRQDITDVENQTDGSWAAVLYSTEGYWGVITTLAATDNDTSTTELERGYCGGEYFRSWVLPHGVNERTGGGWVVTWTRMECNWPFYEDTEFPQIAFFRDTNPEVTVGVYEEACLFGPPAARTVCLAPDTVLVLLSGDENFPWLDGSMLKVVSRTGPANPCDPLEGEAELSCTGINLDFRRTNGGRLLVFSGTHDWPEYPHPRIVEVDTAGNCVELCTLPFDRDPDAIAWHPDCGFAALLVHPARIMLARVDTNSVEVQPLGIFWEPTDGNRVAEANLAIASDGRVVVVWIELDETNAAVLKIGAVGWDTFLGVEESRAKVIPEKITLSAYPNPFNMTTTISFDLRHAEKTSLVVYDVTGRRVRELASEFFEAGSHQLKFDGSGLASGIYFVRLEAGGFTISQKLLLLK